MTTTPLTAEQLAAIRRRYEATEGQWCVSPVACPIPASMADVPALLAELDRVRAELAATRAAAFREAARFLEDTGHDDAVNLLDNITTHACPPGNSALTPCCGKTTLELTRTDRLTYDPAEITCAAARTGA